MIRVIQDECALFIGNEHFEQFQQALANTDVYEQYIDPQKNIRKNYGEAVLNLWCLLLRPEEKITFNETKLFYSPLTKHLLSQIQQNTYFQTLKMKPNLSNSQRLVGAIIMANEIDDWVLSIFQQQKFQHIYAKMVQFHEISLPEVDNETYLVIQQEATQFIKQFFQQPECKKQFDTLLKESVNKIISEINNSLSLK